MRVRTKSLLAAAAMALLASTQAKAAYLVDLTTANAEDFANGAFYFQAGPGSGTGTFNPFLHIQANGVEQGYNTTDHTALSAEGFPEAVDVHTLSLQYSTLSVMNHPDAASTPTDYVQIALDINQGGGNPLLDLVDLRVFLGNAGNLSGFPTFGGNAIQIFDSNSGPDGSGVIRFNNNLGSGSGTADAVINIPKSLFDTTIAANPGHTFVYVFASFTGGNGGFEEFNSSDVPILTADQIASVPEPSSMALTALGAVGLLGYALRKRKGGAAE
jgi:hypothetical protein